MKIKETQNTDTFSMYKVQAIALNNGQGFGPWSQKDDFDPNYFL